VFDFDKPEDGSEGRYDERQRNWRNGTFPVAAPLAASNAVVGAAKHHIWWLIHNLVAHPVIGVAPVRWAFDFHDWTSRKLHGL
jgi:hypothetical protein